MIQTITALLRGCSEIFFLKNTVLGCLLFIMILFFPGLAFAGVLAVVFAYLFSFVFGLKQRFIKKPLYIYNPLLVGLSIGYLYRITPRTVLFIILMSIITLITVILLENLLARLNLPALSLPFVISTSMVYLFDGNLPRLIPNTNLYPAILPLNNLFPIAISGYFESFGALFFMPYLACGIVIATVVGFYSRILLFLSMAGYYFGSAIIALFTQSWEVSFSSNHHYNFILVAMGVGGIFLIPSPRSYLISLVAVAISSLFVIAVQILAEPFTLEVLTLPFNLVCLGFLLLFNITKYPHIVLNPKSTPEETLDTFISTSQRFKEIAIGIGLPFSGIWHVWQGAQGQWTHQGKFENAVDFIINDAHGSPFCEQGVYLTDYYCFGQPIHSPVSGWVRTIVNHLPDNVIGSVDQLNNWGNCIVIESENGIFVEMSHLSQYSIAVSQGDFVAQGTFLALCGNSGYSPQPHLHIQVQKSAAIGSSTLPFGFNRFIEGNQFRVNALPKEKSNVEPIGMPHHQRIGKTHLIDDTIRYRVRCKDKKVDDLILTTKMDENGTTYFDSGKGQLYWTEHNGVFYFLSAEGNDPYLNQIFKAIPSFPITLRKGVFWQDCLPFGAATNKVKQGFWQLFNSFYHNLPKSKTILTCKSKFQIKVETISFWSQKKQASIIGLDSYGEFSQIKIDDIEFQKIKSECKN